MKNFLLLLCIVAAVASCKKKSNPEPQTGAIYGSIYPPGVFSLIYATDASGTRISTEVSPATGTFMFEDLTPGTYTLTVPADPRFDTSGSIELEVQGGQDIDAGVIGFEPLVGPSGAIVGSILPIGFGKSVTVKNLASGVVYSITPNAQTGFFSSTLPNGDYNISFTANAPAEPPADIAVTISGGPVSLGSVICKQGTSGSIIGKVIPAGGFASIKATNVQSGDVVLGTINRTTGAVGFPIMMPGAYKVGITPYVPYLTPADLDVIVATTKETDMGTISLVQDATVRVLTYKIDGTSTTRYNVSGSFTDGILKFSLMQTTLISVGQMLGRQTYRQATLSVAMENITAPGTYTCKGTANSNMTYVEGRRTTPNPQTTTTGTWSINGSDATGVVEIVAIDPAARTIRGTFSATLMNEKSGATPQKKSVTSGVFYLNY
ncbi:hypothetical protein [Pedobacter metabolipauper]|uniref:Carboxypeptidase family protein n=1 Tax=Pedobacter metabolipauper TaxID=425513 RepID=A0A4R6T101_9SPHI|nr:hypothetical protein [Pedobacter metabolipauper]TDQ11729.1 hypothetical protein ATK78_0857 [Pedobacter metabolipauper]